MARNWGDRLLHATEQFRQALLQSLSDLFDIHQRHIPNATLDATVIRAVQSASFGGLFLIDSLFPTHAADRSAKTDTDNREASRPMFAAPQPMRTQPMSHILIDAELG